MESLNYREDEKSRNMINVPLAREKSTLEHRSNNVQHTVENVAHAQPSEVTKKMKFKILILNMCPASVQVKILKWMI